MEHQLKLFITFLILFCISLSSSSQNNNLNIKPLLPEGTYKFHILDSIEATPRQLELTAKFQKAYKNNLDVLNVYFEKLRNKEKADFPKNDQLTEEEFLEFIEFSKDFKLLSSGLLNVTIKYNKNKITFVSSGKLEILNYLEFDLSKNNVHIENNLLPFNDSIVVTQVDNAFREGWKGYKWEFSEPKDIKMPTSETIHDFSSKFYKVTVGTLDKCNKTFMIIKGQEVQNGQKLVDFEIPIKMN